jgi:DNA-binding response OmpR family regulator
MLGTRDILHKPIDYELLMAAIERHCRRSHPKPSIQVLLSPQPIVKACARSRNER